MWVKSTEGVGSTFHYTISYLPVASEDKHIFLKMTAIPSSEKPFAEKKVLLVEPVPLKFKYYEKLILATGATVTKAESLDECFDLLAQTVHFDLVIADSALFDNGDCDQISQIQGIDFNAPEINMALKTFINNKNIRAELPVVLIASDNKQLDCNNTIIELPVGYDKVLKVLEDIL